MNDDSIYIQETPKEESDRRADQLQARKYEKEKSFADWDNDGGIEDWAQYELEEKKREQRFQEYMKKKELEDKRYAEWQATVMRDYWSRWNAYILGLTQELPKFPEYPQK